MFAVAKSIKKVSGQLNQEILLNNLYTTSRKYISIHIFCLKMHFSGSKDMRHIRCLQGYFVFGNRKFIVFFLVLVLVLLIRAAVVVVAATFEVCSTWRLHLPNSLT